MSIFKKLNRLRDVRSPDQRGSGFWGYFILRAILENGNSLLTQT